MAAGELYAYADRNVEMWYDQTRGISIMRRRMGWCGTQYEASPDKLVKDLEEWGYDSFDYVPIHALVRSMMRIGERRSIRLRKPS